MCATNYYYHSKNTGYWKTETENEKNTAQIFESYHARGPLTSVAGKKNRKKNGHCFMLPLANI